MRSGQVPQRLRHCKSLTVILHRLLQEVQLGTNILSRSEPGEGPDGLLLSSVAQQPQRRLGDSGEGTEEEEVEERGQTGDVPPVEAGAEAVAGEDAKSQHKAEQGQEGSPVLESADRDHGNIKLRYRIEKFPTVCPVISFYFYFYILTIDVMLAFTCTGQQEVNSLQW